MRRLAIVGIFAIGLLLLAPLPARASATPILVWPSPDLVHADAAPALTAWFAAAPPE